MRQLISFVSLLLACLVGSGGCLARQLGMPPEVSLQCKAAKGDRPQFAINARRVNSIESFVIWSDTKGEPLWAFCIGPTRVSPDDLKCFRYGVLPHVPDPSLGRVKQVFPGKGEPRPIAPGERFYVRVDYQYDQLFAPCIGERYFLFEKRADGSIALREKSANAEMPTSVKEVFIKMVGPPDLSSRIDECPK